MQYMDREGNIVLLRVYSAKMASGFRQEAAEPRKRTAGKKDEETNFTDMFNRMIGKVPAVV
jgi:hypothetical protein